MNLFQTQVPFFTWSKLQLLFAIEFQAKAQPQEPPKKPKYYHFLHFLSLKSFLKDHILNFKSQFLKQNILALFGQWNICKEEFWKSILLKYFKTNIRIYTNFDEWNQQVCVSKRHVWIHHPKYGCCNH
jgi:hypothetical protein